jgi:hypothetical protein
MMPAMSLSVLMLVLPAVMGGMDIPGDMMDEIHMWNIVANCYGQEAVAKYAVAHHKAMDSCKGKTPALPDNEPLLAAAAAGQGEVVRNVRYAPQPAGAARRRFSRQVDTGLLEPTAADFAEFFAHAQQYKGGMLTKLGNLSCVLTKMGMLEASGSINLKHFTEDLWTIVGQNAGGKDPSFVQKMRDGFVDCYNVAQAWPQSNLDRNPMTKQWGRQMIFFHCAKKMELKSCAQLQLKEYVEMMYGPMDMNQMPEFNGDKYEAALFGMKVMMDMESPEEDVVRKFLWSSPNRAH